MQYAFPWPLSQGEWLAFLSAAITIVFGLLLLVFPRLSLRLLRLQTLPGGPEGVAEVRSTLAGFYLGLGICCILLAQPLLYLALGASWAATAFGRLVAIVFDRAATPFNFVALIIDLLLTAGALAFATGYLA